MVTTTTLFEIPGFMDLIVVKVTRGLIAPSVVLTWPSLLGAMDFALPAVLTWTRVMRWPLLKAGLNILATEMLFMFSLLSVR